MSDTQSTEMLDGFVFNLDSASFSLSCPLLSFDGFDENDIEAFVNDFEALANNEETLPDDYYHKFPHENPYFHLHNDNFFPTCRSLTDDKLHDRCDGVRSSSFHLEVESCSKTLTSLGSFHSKYHNHAAPLSDASSQINLQIPTLAEKTLDSIHHLQPPLLCGNSTSLPDPMASRDGFSKVVNKQVQRKAVNPKRSAPKAAEARKRKRVNGKFCKETIEFVPILQLFPNHFQTA